MILKIHVRLDFITQQCAFTSQDITTQKNVWDNFFLAYESIIFS